MRLVLLGPPGVGKGTQGQVLAARLHGPHVAAGDLLRDHIARGTEFGRKVEAAIAAGNLASDEDMLYWIRRRLDEPDAQAGYILDGFPRNLAQAQAFTETLDAVIDLKIAEYALVERLAGRLICPHCDSVYHVVHHKPKHPGVCDRDGTPLLRRPDDQPEAIRRRLRVYHALTEPLQAYYGQRGLLVPVDASGEATAVTQRIWSALSAHGVANGVF